MPWGFLVRLGPRCTFKMRAKPVPEALLDRCNYRTSAVSAPGPVLIGSYRSFPCVAPVILDAAMRLYERMGFKRAPELDFKPAPGVTARGYLLTVKEEDL